MFKFCYSILCSILLAYSALGSTSLLAASLPKGKVWAGTLYFSWGSPVQLEGNAVPKGVNDLAFPFVLEPETLRKTGFFISRQYYFTGSDKAGYLGLQTLEDVNGKHRMRAIFSSFDPAATTTDKNCRGGADGGGGVSCSFEFDANYGARYDIKIHKKDTNLWSGDLIEVKTGKTIHLGSYKFPDNTAKLQLLGRGFLEYYGGKPQWTLNKCSELQKIKAKVGPAYSEDAGGVVSPMLSITEQQPYNNEPLCHGAEIGFHSNIENFAIHLKDKTKTYFAEGRQFERGWVKSNN